MVAMKGGEMETYMEEIAVPVEFHKHVGYYASWYQASGPRNLPWMVRRWMENHALDMKEDSIMSLEEYHIILEVEVRTDKDGKAFHAECQTECPSYVQAWAEIEAMKRYNTPKENQHA